MVEFLFGDLPAAAASESPSTLLRIETHGVPARYLLRRDDDERWRGRSLTGLTSAVLDEAQRAFVDCSRDGVVLHAAAVARGRRAIVIPGPTGAGKTSLCAWLLSRGFDYLTDDLAQVDSGALSLRCFPRPLHVKRSGFASVLGLLGRDALVHLRETPSGRLIRYSVLRPCHSLPMPETALFLLPRFDPRAKCELRLLSKAESGRRLMACVTNGRNLDDHGFNEAARLARAVPAYSLDYAGFEPLAPVLDPLLSSGLGA